MKPFQDNILSLSGRPRVVQAAGLPFPNFFFEHTKNVCGKRVKKNLFIFSSESKLHANKKLQKEHLPTMSAEAELVRICRIKANFMK